MLMTLLLFVNWKEEVWIVLFLALMIMVRPRDKSLANRNLVSTLASILTQIGDKILDCFFWGSMKVSHLLPTREQLPSKVLQNQFISRSLIEFVIHWQVGRASAYQW